MSDLILTHPQPIIKKPVINHQKTIRKTVEKCPERFFKVPSIVIHPDSLVLYSKLEYYEGHSPSRSHSHLLKSARNHHSLLSAQAKRKLNKAIKYLIFLANDKKVYNTTKKKSFNYKVGFITLTLASQQIHTDRFITSNLLHQFLVEAKQKWKVTRYVWKAEYQRNGNIHYHILVDKFIPWAELRNCWNRIQNKHGYIDRAIYKNSSYSYNSTDIHSLYNISDVSNYVTKYMSKSFNKCHTVIKRSDFNILPHNYEEIAQLSGQSLVCSTIDDNNDIFYFKLALSQLKKQMYTVSPGAKSFLKSQINRFRIWGCSQDLSIIKGYQGMLENNFTTEIDKLRNDSNCKVYDSDYYSVFYFKNGFLSNIEYPALFSYFTTYLQHSFKSYTPQLILEIIFR